MFDINKVAIVTVRQTLEPAFPDSPIKPSTFPDADGKGKYILYANNGGTDAVIDTHQSQANRIEPAFDNSGLIPDHVIKVGEDTVPLTHVGHRVADAAVRFSDRAEIVASALTAFAKGDSLPLAKLAPTTLVFGTWDSRTNSGATGVKVVRQFNSEIRATNVTEVPAAGQFVSSIPRPDDLTNTVLSEEGMLDCPYSSLSKKNPCAPGGVIVHGEIVRTATLNVRGAFAK